MKRIGLICSAIALGVGIAAASAQAHERYRHDDAWRTGAVVGGGYLLFPWGALAPMAYAGAYALEPTMPAEPEPAAAAPSPCVKTNVARLANACPPAAPAS